MGLELPSPPPPPPDSAPPSPPYRDHTGALLRENAAFRQREAELEDRLRRYQAILEERRLRTIAPPVEKRTIPQWAAGLVAVIAAFGTAGGFKIFEALTKDPVATPADLQAKENDSRERDEQVIEYLADVADDERRRNEITITVLCALNGGPPARDVKCPEPTKACEPRTLQDGKIVPGQPICKAVQPWPPRRRPPKPPKSDP